MEGPAASPLPELMDVEEEQQRQRQQVQARAARRLIHLGGPPHTASSLGAVHLSPRQRIIYGQRGGTGCGAGP